MVDWVQYRTKYNSYEINIQRQEDKDEETQLAHTNNNFHIASLIIR